MLDNSKKYKLSLSISSRQDEDEIRSENKAEMLLPFDEIAEAMQNSVVHYNLEPLETFKQCEDLKPLKSQTTAATKTQLNMINQRTKVSIIGAISLVMTVVAGALAIPLQVNLPLNSSFLKLSWR